MGTKNSKDGETYEQCNFVKTQQNSVVKKDEGRKQKIKDKR
jgi:hypothetical protein